jgi:glutamate racemase
MNPPSSGRPHIGIFDSGVGGLSILRRLRREAPGYAVSYLADNRFLPYGDKSPEWLMERCGALTEHLLSLGASLLLVACNTATTQTIAALRRRWPEVPFVGVEPGIKPAVLASRNRRVAVMATAATVESQRLRLLVEAHRGDAYVHLQPCPGLADAIERGDDAAIDTRLDESCSELRAAEVDTVALGCTHYPLVSDRIARRMGSAVTLVDTAQAVCRRIEALLPCTAHGTGTLRIEATGDTAAVKRAAQRWIDPTIVVPRAGLEPAHPAKGRGF